MAAGLGAESLAAKFRAGDGLEGYLGRPYPPTDELLLSKQTKRTMAELAEQPQRSPKRKKTEKENSSW